MRLTTALNMTSTPVFYSRGGAAPSSPASLFASGQQGLWLEVVQSGGFSPALLFAGGQQGLLLEPEVFSPASLFAGDQEGLLFEPER